MKKIDLYSKDYCAYCHRAKELLDIKGVRYNEIDVTYDNNLESEMQQRSGQLTVPQVFIDNQHVGGCSDLFTLDEKGELDLLLSQCSA